MDLAKSAATLVASGPCGNFLHLGHANVSQAIRIVYSATKLVSELLIFMWPVIGWPENICMALALLLFNMIILNLGKVHFWNIYNGRKPMGVFKAVSLGHNV